MRNEPKGGWPLCVRLQLHRREVWGWAIITVGTVRRGIHGTPRLEYINLTSRALMLRGEFNDVTKLSDLTRALADVEVADRMSGSDEPLRDADVTEASADQLHLFETRIFL